MKYKIFLPILLLIIFFKTAFSQEDKGDFFEKDYATKVGQAQPTKVHKKKVVDDRKDIKRIDLESEAPSEVKATVTTTPAQTQDIIQDQKKDYSENDPKVYAVGAILNSLDSRHFISKLNDLINASREFKFSCDTVYSIGTPFASLVASEAILAQGRDDFKIFELADVVSVWELPQKYSKVKSSPTWIVKTTIGEVLVEGIEPFERFMAKGKDESRLKFEALKLGKLGSL